MRNLAAIRTIATELNKLDPSENKFGWAHLHPDGIVIGLRFGVNGHCMETSRLLQWPLLGELTIAGAMHVIQLLHAQMLKDYEDTEEEEDT